MPINIVPTDPNAPAVPVDEATGIAGNQSFDEYGASLPTDARSFLDDAAVASPEPGDKGGNLASSVSASDEPTAALPRRKRVDLSRRMKKFRKKISALPARWFDHMAQDRPEWALSDDEREDITDSIDTVFEVLEIDVEVEPLGLKLTSIWWVVAYPLVVIAALFLTKREAVKARYPDEPEPEPPEVPLP